MSTTPDLTGARWVASSFSGNGGGNCVEWAPAVAATSGVVPVRDSKIPEGPTLLVRPASWACFIDYASGHQV